VDRIVQNLEVQPIETDRGLVSIEVTYGCVTDEDEHDIDVEALMAAALGEMETVGGR
jgi:hypothetical protein